MPTAFDAKDCADCTEAEHIIDLAMGTSDQPAHDELMERAYRLLLPLVSKEFPQAQYLYGCHFLSRECKREEDIEPRYIQLIQAAAHAGYARAQFRLGQMLDREGELGHDAEQSAHWFRLSAEQDDCYAQWVHGLNLLSGCGLPQDEALGLTFIERAAAGKFEGALGFLAQAYADGTHGYPKDAQKAQFLRERMQDADVIHY